MFSAFGDSLHSSAISCMAYGKWAHTLARLQASRGCFLVTSETLHSFFICCTYSCSWR